MITTKTQFNAKHTYLYTYIHIYLYLVNPVKNIILRNEPILESRRSFQLRVQSPLSADSSLLPFLLYLFPFLLNKPNFLRRGYVGFRHPVRPRGINAGRACPNEANFISQFSILNSQFRSPRLRNEPNLVNPVNSVKNIILRNKPISESRRSFQLRVNQPPPPADSSILPFSLYLFTCLPNEPIFTTQKEVYQI